MAEAPRAMVVMGVSGNGKTTLGRALAERLGFVFIEGDAIHPPANIAKMSAGIPLDDADREPWLRDIADALGRAAGADGGVAACSALKRIYRDLLRSQLGRPIAFVHPAMEREALRQRLTARTDHFMPASLLDSQFAALEQPGADEFSVTVDASLPTADQVDVVLAGLGLTAARARP